MRGRNHPLNATKKLYILIAVLAVLLIVTLGLIVTLRPDTSTPSTPPAQTESTLEPSAEPGADPTLEPDASDDPLAGLSEEEIGALALAEENHEEGDGAAD